MDEISRTQAAELIWHLLTYAERRIGWIIEQAAGYGIDSAQTSELLNRLLEQAAISVWGNSGVQDADRLVARAVEYLDFEHLPIWIDVAPMRPGDNLLDVAAALGPRISNLLVGNGITQRSTVMLMPDDFLVGLTGCDEDTLNTIRCILPYSPRGSDRPCPAQNLQPLPPLSSPPESARLVPVFVPALILHTPWGLFTLDIDSDILASLLEGYSAACTSGVRRVRPGEVIRGLARHG